MKYIDYRKQEERRIDGMYTVFTGHDEDKTYESDKYAVSAVFSPGGYLVAPAFDYLKTLFHKNRSKGYRKQVAQAICHWYNFLRLHGLTGKEELTTDMLSWFIKYLSALPKSLSKRITIDLQKLEYLPVHPYVEGIEDIDTVRKIYKEWYNYPFNKFKADEDDKVVPLHRIENLNAEFDEEAWRYPYEYIRDTLQYTLEFLDWLSESKRWKYHFKPIDPKVTKRELRSYTKNGKTYTYYLWVGLSNIIKNTTKLKPAPVRSQRGERIFYESELRAFLNEKKVLEKNHHRKFMLILLLLSGMRIAECLNLLVKNVRVALPRGAERYNPFSERTIVHWEDMFKVGRDKSDKMDIYIDQYFRFYVQVEKRRAYESQRRKNKKSGKREVKLQDVFGLPELLDLDCDSIFVSPEDYHQMFKDEINQIKDPEERQLFAKNPYKIVTETINYYRNCAKKGIDMEHPDFLLEYKIKIQKFRSLIDNSWFGKLLRNHLIERYILQMEKKSVGLNKDYLFINPDTEKAGPFISQIPTTWLKDICESQSIQRNSFELYNMFGHNIKSDLTLHSFRHTYISARIGKEHSEGTYNPATLKMEVGHVPDSTVTETVYYWADRELEKKAATKVYRYLEKHLDGIKLVEKDSTDNEQDNTEELN